MITDMENWLSRAQAVTTGTQYSDAFDRGLAADIGRGYPIRARLQVTTAFTGGTNETFNFVESANADLSSPTVLFTTGAVVEANLTIGRVLMDQPIPPTTKRYLGWQYVASGTHSTGNVDALLVLDSSSGDAIPTAGNGL